jgi:uncharacterized protein (DUF58 family)
MKYRLGSWMRVAPSGPDGRIRVAAKNIYLMPTGYGLLYGAAVLLMLIGSLNYASNLGLLFSFLFVGLGVVTILHSWHNLLDLAVHSEPAAPLFTGHQALFPLCVEAPSGRDRPGLRLAPRDAPQNGGSFSLNGGGRECLPLRLQAEHRGELALGIVRLSSVYPLGLVRAWALVDCGARVLVYPRPFPGGSRSEFPDYVRSDRGDRGVGTDDFVGPRPYRPGDPPRHLDWKALARERGLVSRQFGGDRAQRVWLDSDLVGGHDMEERLSRLCQLVLQAANSDLRYGLRLAGREISPSSGDLHKHRCLAALALFGKATRRGL